MSAGEAAGGLVVHFDSGRVFLGKAKVRAIRSRVPYLAIGLGA
jgi:hypothetical protein